MMAHCVAQLLVDRGTMTEGFTALVPSTSLRGNDSPFPPPVEGGKAAAVAACASTVNIQ